MPAAALIGAAVIGGVGSAVSANQIKKANDGARGIADRLTYEPIDLEKVKADAANLAVKNATASLNLERQLTPDVAAARAGLSKSVNDQLALGGRIPADIANRVANAARVAGGSSGGFGGTPGVTAATLGTTALDLLRSRQGAAQQLTLANPLPTAGLDPGALASLEVQQNSNMNAFNAAKAGVQTNLLNSNAQANAGAIGGAANSLSSLVGLYGMLNGGKTSNYNMPSAASLAFPTSGTTTMPNMNMSAIGMASNPYATNPVILKGWGS